MALLAAVLLAYPFVLSSSVAVNIGIVALVYATAANGWNVLGGYTGQISFGHALFFGTAAYTTILVARAGQSPWLGILAGALLAGIVSVIVGWPCFRLRGHYYSIATIAVADIVQILVNNFTPLGAAQGMQVPLQKQGLASLQFSLRDKTPYYLTALGVYAVSTLLVWTFVRARAGRYVRCVRDDSVAAAAMGVPVLRYKLYSAGVSGAVTGLAGGFFAMYVLFVDPDSVLSLTISITVALTAVLGGAGRLFGPLLGSFVLITLQETTRSYLSGSGRSVDLLAYGVLIIAVAVAEPRGLIGLTERLGRRARTALHARRGGAR